jgi:hypothetical protein
VTYARAVAIVSSSLRPIRRATISSLPAAVSNRHPSAAFTIGTGNGQFSLPMTSVLPLGFASSRCHCSRAATANTRRFIWAVAGSDEATSSRPSGPKDGQQRVDVLFLDGVEERLDGVFG